MVYILLGVGLLICILLLSTLTRSKKVDVDPVRTESVDIIVDEVPSVDYSADGAAFASHFLQNSFMDDPLRNEFAHYKGKTVSWRGRLQLAYAFKSDMTFGSKPGTKATIHLCDIRDQYGMFSAVTCVVAFENGTAETLRSLINKEIVFRARLVSLNSTTREIVLDEAKLV